MVPRAWLNAVEHAMEASLPCPAPMVSTLGWWPHSLFPRWHWQQEALLCALQPRPQDEKKSIVPVWHSGDFPPLKLKLSLTGVNYVPKVTCL